MPPQKLKMAAQYISTISDMKQLSNNLVNDLQTKLDAVLQLIADDAKPSGKENTTEETDKTDDNAIVFHDLQNTNSLSSEEVSSENNNRLERTKDDELLIFSVRNLRENIFCKTNKDTFPSSPFHKEKTTR